MNTQNADLAESLDQCATVLEMLLSDKPGVHVSPWQIADTAKDARRVLEAHRSDFAKLQKR